MLPSFRAGTIEHGAICCVGSEDLALEDAAVFERKVEDVSVRGVRHRIESHYR